MRQSPVDIDSDATLASSDADFEMKIATSKGATKLTTDTRNVSVKIEPGNSIMHAGKQFDLVELHFHSPSEHTLNGVRHCVELHLVHMAADTTKLVFGVFFEVGDHEDAFLKTLFSNGLPKAQGAQPIPRRVDLPKLLCVSEEPVFTYPGSLTTPPFSEDVTWCVSERVHEASAAQLAIFRESVPHDNNRETQTLHDRRVSRTTCKVTRQNAGSEALLLHLITQ